VTWLPCACVLRLAPGSLAQRAPDEHGRRSIF
jgi:hypothetical protein